MGRVRRLLVTSALLALVGCTSSHSGASHPTDLGSRRGPVPNCPKFDGRILPDKLMRHPGRVADNVVQRAFVDDAIVKHFAAEIEDGIAPGGKSLSSHASRRVWLVLHRSVMGPGEPTVYGASPGTVLVTGTLVDDLSLKVGPHYSCNG
jgi:hypothetical protein